MQSTSESSNLKTVPAFSRTALTGCRGAFNDSLRHREAVLRGREGFCFSLMLSRSALVYPNHMTTNHTD